MERVIVKLSGEAFAGGKGAGINASSVREIAKEIKGLVDLNYQVGIIIGAGNIWRGRDAAENGMERASADYMGMLGTILNSLALQNALESLGVPTRTMTAIEIPSVAEPYIRRRAIHHLEKNNVVIFGGGTGNPFFSTDSAAALRAAEVGAKTILMAKNGCDGVYDSDPRQNPNAQKFSKISYQELIERELQVMDLTAATLCKENDIKTIVFDMNVKGNVVKVLEHPEIGTIIENQ
ncbi:MAG: UMP kinase [Bacilli bacterium]|nr:UMP kinase [Bacilli bacterium]